jgi:3-oxoacyl-[acyl-carrier protein] reductase
MLCEIQSHFQRIDVLVNNAGTLVRRARLEELDEALWDRVMDVNLKSVFLVTQAVVPIMKAQGGGRIVNISSIAARNGGGPGGIAYACSKGGVSTLTRALAKELAEYNIFVNAVAPGVITTPFHDKFSSPEILRDVSGIPLKRVGSPEDVTGAVLFLASEYASYATGEIIEINGGQLMS